MLRRQKLILAALGFLLSPAPGLAAANQTPEQTSVEATALNNQAVASADARRYQEAIESLKRAIALQPNLTMAHYNLGCIYQYEGHFDLSIDPLKQAVR